MEEGLLRFYIEFFKVKFSTSHASFTLQAVYPDTPNRLLNPYSIDPSMDRITNQMNSLSVAQPDFNKRWVISSIDADLYD